jgi:hypothetical protein
MMRIEYNFVRYEGTEEEPVQILCGRDEATCTIFICTDTMPDGEEFGLSVQVTEVVDELDEFRLKTAQEAIDRYRKENE